MKTTKTLKLQVRVGDLDLPERRGTYTSSREEEQDAQICPCGKTKDSRNSRSGIMCNVQGGTGCVRRDEENGRI